VPEGGRVAVSQHAPVAGPGDLGRVGRRSGAHGVNWDSVFGWTSSVDGWVALFTLSVLEIVLGIDNVVFVSILAGKLPKDQRERARKLGMFLAMFIRVALLGAITWVMGLTATLFSLLGHDVTGRDLIL